MDVFRLRETLVDEYEQFATSFTTIRASDIEEQVKAISNLKIDAITDRAQRLPMKGEGDG